MNKQWKLSVGAAVLAMSFGANAAVVDLFTTGQTILVDETNGTTAYADGLFSQAGSAGDTTILGEYRDLWVTALSGAAGAGVGIGSRLGVVGGLLRFSNDSGVTGVGEVQWDGNDNSSSIASAAGSGLNGYDLTQGGTLDAFELITVASDLGYKFEVTIYSDTDVWARVNFDATAVADDGTPEVSYISFDGFTPGACGTYNAAPGVNLIECGTGGAPDLTAITAIVARLNTGDPFDPNGAVASTVDIDLRLTSIRTVPEPGVLALMGMGLLAAGFAGRRRKSQA